eukprot:Tbor_TRINITY_DN5327_c6_g1::TRINITY_DN5327_c6_g1_i1::g.4965::m.4965/K12823/DDX5, DBP2; ATP-dependent RNA helicase DDX5/DBP2
MSERTYDPFNGHSSRHNSDRGGLGANLNNVDWKKMSERADWVGNAATVTTNAISQDVAVHGQGLPPQEAIEWRAAHNVTTVGENCPAPMPEFAMLTMLPPFIQRKFEAQGFKNPTAIQAQAWPILFQHRDFVGIAKTGSGKTLAFIVPAIAHIAVQQQLRPGDGPIVVVLAPTRELAQQIEVETKKVLPTTMRCTCIFGGAPKGPQINALRDGVHILVATPGRLIDFLEIRRTNLTRTTYLVLDEADRMLDMGFEPQVRTICGQIRTDRQTIMFSATWPKEIQRLATQFMRDTIRIHIGSTDLLANPDVTQHFVYASDAEKFGELRKIMDSNRERRVLVFCKTKKTADFLERQMRSIGHDVMAIHGDKEQRQRDYILDRFRRESRMTLVATDVAARGLDIKNLEMVVNYDFPMQIDDYVHRIGRTGRAGCKGDSWTFMSRGDIHVTSNVVRELLKILEKAGQVIPDWIREWSMERGKSNGYNKRGRDNNDYNNNNNGGYNGNANGRYGERRPPGSLHYQHSNAPSFNPYGNGNNNGFFGQAPGAVAVPFHNSNGDSEVKRYRPE